MVTIKRRLAATSVAAMLGIGALAPAAALAWDCPPPPPPPDTKSKCNAGNGNGSESLESTGHCTNGDPGNSYAAGNRGGDEVSTSSASNSNPGGNNVP